ncbi:MAG: JAB domain-containing protein [Thermonemataceae bacterium]
MNIHLTEAQKIKILNSEDVYEVMQQVLLRENKIERGQEHFWVIGLDSQNKILFIELISLGSLTQALVEPPEVFRVAIYKLAVQIVLIHNHPSGELKPSENDLDVTDRLIQVGKILKIPVLDHLIITETAYLSFLNEDILEELEKSTKYVPPYELIARIKAEAIATGKEMGEKIGREEGEKLGKIQALQEMAQRMKQAGYEVKKIVQVTGLTEKEINDLSV